MPEKRDGYTQVSLQVPDDLLAALRLALGGETLNGFICAAIAKRLGRVYTPPPRGRRKKADEGKKPAKKGRPKK